MTRNPLGSIGQSAWKCDLVIVFVNFESPPKKRTVMSSSRPPSITTAMVPVGDMFWLFAGPAHLIEIFAFSFHDSVSWHFGFVDSLAGMTHLFATFSLQLCQREIPFKVLDFVDLIRTHIKESKYVDQSVKVLQAYNA